MGKLEYIIKKCIRGVIIIMGFIFQPLICFFLKLRYDRATVPPITDQILKMSATMIAGKIRSKQLTAVEVMTCFIKRTQLVNPLVNVVAANRYSAALEEADKLDKQLLDGNPDIQNLPFLGVPISIKEAFELEGMPNTSGLVCRRDKISTSTSPVVRKLLNAGAIPFVVTNISELCMWFESSNNLYGRSKNAYNTQRIVGGSSGGEGCIISSGASVFGIGSDIGGSIRMPAFFNGIFGHKPSNGAVDNSGQFPIPTGDQMELLTTGPMCRFASDLLPMFKVMSGDPTSLKLNEDVRLNDLKFFTMENDGGSLLLSSVSSELVAAQRNAVAYLEKSLGIRVTTVNLRKMKYSFEMWSARMSTPGNTSFSELMTGKGTTPVNGIKEFGRWLFGLSDHTLPAIMLAITECFKPVLDKSNHVFLEKLSALKEEMKELLGNGGILLYPSHPCTAQIHNQPLSTPANFAYTAIFNALGLPVTQCPLGLSKDGLPLGIQVVGAMNEDRNTIAVARCLAEGPAGWVAPGV